ncbi:MAG TPA: DUF5985 family protein [Egibacteraceae bacterium]|nr:DUF5985 family protein [Egibacteraceae bacterium]
MRPMLHGAIAMGSFVAGLFFLRFYRVSRDALFAFFGAAFWLLAVNNAALAMTDPQAETRVLAFYGLRLLAFLLIIVGIIQKNRAPS